MELNSLRQQISADINNSGLPIDAVYYVVKDVLNEVINLFNKQIEIENNAAATQGSKSEVKDNKSAVAANNIEKEEK